MTPATIWPCRSSAIEMAKIGMPCRKLVVPSSGSTIQRCCVVRALDRRRVLHRGSIARPRAAQLGEEDFLGLVGLADKVARTLERDLQVLHLAEVARQRLAGLQRGPNHDIDKRRTGHVINIP